MRSPSGENQYMDLLKALNKGSAVKIKNIVYLKVISTDT